VITSIGLSESKKRRAPGSTQTLSTADGRDLKARSKMTNPGQLILVADDFKDDRDMVAHFLSLKGFRVTLASDGEEALNKAFQLHPDLIILDLWMPGIGGWEALRRLKGDARTQRIPIVVLTARDFVSAKAVGSDGCLIKPCPPDILFAEINRVLNRGTGNDPSFPQMSV
jgi:two-component system, cell cycle response regulator DivK